MHAPQLDSVPSLGYLCIVSQKIGQLRVPHVFAPFFNLVFASTATVGGIVIISVHGRP
jgi:hypothetical protein